MKWKLILYIAVAYVILQLPIIGTFLRAANTMIHESGHAVVVLLTRGQVEHISLFMNTEGVTHAASASWLGGFLTGLAGYTFSALVILILAHFWRGRQYRLIHLILLIFAAADLIFWVRNFYGIIWLLVFMAVLILLMQLKKTTVVSSLTLILLIILLADSLRSGYDIFILGLFHPKSAGDATYMTQLTHVPALFWGTLFFAITLWFAWLAFKQLAKARKRNANRITRT